MRVLSIFVFCVFLSIANATPLSRFLGNRRFNEFSRSGDGRSVGDERSLVLLHVLFRHGNRTANGPEELYPKDPYVNNTYFPIGLGQLTNAGKQREYSIGTALRERYNAFLGDDYYPEMVDAWSTDYNRTKMSLQLALAGLFPPKRDQDWMPGMNWQPVPFNYRQRMEDPILLGVFCPNYVNIYQEVSRSFSDQYAAYSNEFAYISRNTGLNATTFADVYNLYFGLSTELEYGLELPQWTRSVWPDIIIDMAIKEYYVSMGSPELRQMAAGFLLKKITIDTLDKIKKHKAGERNGRKIYMYSAHESNVAQMLVGLDIFDPPHIPNYGSYIVLEVHNIDNVYGVKIYYENYTNGKLQLLTIPGCASFCPFRDFYRLIKPIIPADDNLCAGKETDKSYF